MNSVKYQFDKYFDGGLQDLTSRLQEQFDRDIFQVQKEAEAKGFDEGQRQALSELKIQENTILSAIESDLERIFQDISTMHSLLVIKSAQAVKKITQILSEIIDDKLLYERVDSTITSIMPDLIEMPRLVMRLPENLIDMIRNKIDSIALNQGYAGKIIYVPLQGNINSPPSIEWANGGVVIDNENKNVKLKEKLEEFIISIHNNNAHTEETMVEQI